MAIAAILLASVTAAGCATSDGRSAVRSIPPAALLVVVDPPASDQTVSTSDGLRFEATAADMQQMLAQELRAVDASSRVVTRAELGEARPDLVLTLLPAGPIEFSHAGTSNFLGAGGLWLVTWIGGLLVPDSLYGIKMDAKYRLALTEDDWFERPIASGEVDLSFFDRNDFWSMPTLQSLIMPPFWTTDQQDKTSATLTRASMRMAASQIAMTLKQDFEPAAATAFRCSVEVKQPRNGQAVTGTEMPVELIAVSRSATPVSRVTAAVNGGNPVDLQLGRQVGDFGIEVRGTLSGLRPEAENWVILQVTTEKTFTRTIRLAAAGN